MENSPLNKVSAFSEDIKVNQNIIFIKVYCAASSENDYAQEYEVAMKSHE